MIYIMVTKWDRHWDKLDDNTTFYALGMLKGEMNKNRLYDDLKTIFIKRGRDTGKFEKAWVGSAFGFKPGRWKEKDCIYFRVKIKEGIECPSEYTEYPEGWYIDEEEIVEKESRFDPPFFEKLRSTNSWSEFENLNYVLLKLIGVHEIFKYEQQQGQADGFFKFKNLAVLYDCTLKDDFEKSKMSQIENYCAQLKSGSVNYKDKTFNVVGHQKQVWVISRGGHRTIKKIDGVTVKEIHITKLIDVYRERLIKTFDENELESSLKSI